MQNAEFRMQSYGIGCADLFQSVAIGRTAIQHSAFIIQHSKKHWQSQCFFVATQVYKPGSVLTAIYLALRLLAGSSHLLGTAGSAYMSLHGVAPDRVYSTPMFP